MHLCQLPIGAVYGKGTINHGEDKTKSTATGACKAASKTGSDHDMAIEIVAAKNTVFYDAHSGIMTHTDTH